MKEYARHRKRRHISIDDESRFTRKDVVRDYKITTAAENMRDSAVHEKIGKHEGAHYASGGVTLFTSGTGLVDTCSKESTACSEKDADEATTVINLSSEGEIMVTHTSKSTKFIGTKAI